MARISCEAGNRDCTHLGEPPCGRCGRARVFLEGKLVAMEISRRGDPRSLIRPVYQVVGVEVGEGKKGVLNAMVLRVDSVVVARVSRGVIYEFGNKKILNLVGGSEGD